MSILTCCTCNQSFSQEAAGMHRCGAHPPEVTTTPIAERIERVLAFWQRAGGSSRLTLPDLLIAEMHEAVDESRQREAALVAVIEKAVMRLGSPTMDYAPEIAVREYRESAEEATKVLLEAIANFKGRAG